MPQETCPGCAADVRVHTSDEGTGYYEPLGPQRRGGSPTEARPCGLCGAAHPCAHLPPLSPDVRLRQLERENQVLREGLERVRRLLVAYDRGRVEEAYQLVVGLVGETGEVSGESARADRAC